MVTVRYLLVLVAFEDLLDLGELVECSCNCFELHKDVRKIHSEHLSMPRVRRTLQDLSTGHINHIFNAEKVASANQLEHNDVLLKLRVVVLRLKLLDENCRFIQLLF